MEKQTTQQCNELLTWAANATGIRNFNHERRRGEWKSACSGILRHGVDYTVSGAVISLTNAGDYAYALYFR